VRDRSKTYASGTIAVRFEPRRCIHAAECVRGLPDVFDPDRKPWIEPGTAGADAIAAVVARCPTGALHFERLDGGPAEVADAVNGVRVTRNGPLHLRGTIEVLEDGAVIARDVRVALCRCGATRNPPFCDNSHRAIRFVDPADVFEGGVKPGDPTADGTLRVTAESKGPYRLEGPLEVVSADGRVRLAGGRAALCRCGTSRNKPFCDGSHRDLQPPES
jgi:CDGSH-type Zn-finger protein/uncharacterized Fe-S cluster protein YjdI